MVLFIMTVFFLPDLENEANSFLLFLYEDFFSIVEVTCQIYVHKSAKIKLIATTRERTSFGNGSLNFHFFSF